MSENTKPRQTTERTDKCIKVLFSNVKAYWLSIGIKISNFK